MYPEYREARHRPIISLTTQPFLIQHEISDLFRSLQVPLLSKTITHMTGAVAGMHARSCRPLSSTSMSKGEPIILDMTRTFCRSTQMILHRP